ncbi:hypothetical protein SARC_16646, partial [Sphaeroforma arctica JP610]
RVQDMVMAQLLNLETQYMDLYTLDEQFRYFTELLVVVTSGSRNLLELDSTSHTEPDASTPAPPTDAAVVPNFSVESLMFYKMPSLDRCGFVISLCVCFES